MTNEGKGKEIIPSPIPKVKRNEMIIKDIELDKYIVIPNCDLSNLTIKKMDILGELRKKRDRKQKL